MMSDKNEQSLIFPSSDQTTFDKRFLPQDEQFRPVLNSFETSTPNGTGEKYYRNSPSSRIYKVVVIGEIGCGKSALIRRYIHNYYSSESSCNRSTIGVDFHLKIVQYAENLEIRLQLWDIAGQERFASMTRAYYKGTMGALLVFDHSNANSYEAIKRYTSLSHATRP